MTHALSSLSNSRRVAGMSRLPLVVGIVVTLPLLVVVAAVGLVVVRDQRIEGETIQAARQYEVAVGMLADGRFPDARGEFAALARGHGENEVIGPPSRAAVTYCDAMIAWRTHDHLRALALLDKVDTSTVPGPARIDRHRERILADLRFAELVAGITASRDAGRFDVALDRIAGAEGLRTEGQRKTLATLSTQIQAQRNDARVEQDHRDAEALLADGRHDAALTAVRRAQRLQSRPTVRLEALRKRILAEQRFVRLATRAAAAQERGDLKEALDAYAQASEFRGRAGSDERHRQIAEQTRQVHGELEFRAGRSAEQRRDADAAKAHYEAAARLADHGGAREALAKIEQRSKREPLIDEGRRALRVGDADGAIRKIREAIALGAGPEVSQLLTEAKLAAKLEEARALSEQGSVSEARVAYSAVLRMQPDHGGAGAALAALTRRQAYLEHLRSADAMSAEGRFAGARKLYQLAAQAMPSVEIRARLEDAEFNDLLTKARLAMDRYDWRSAEALLKTAARSAAVGRHTQLLRQLQQRVDRRVNPAETRR